MEGAAGGILPLFRCLRSRRFPTHRLLIARVVILRAVAGAFEHTVGASEINPIIAA